MSRKPPATIEWEYYMSWKGLKKIAEERLCDALKGRLHFHATGYHAAYEGRGKFWITLDRKPIYDACNFKYGVAYKRARNRLLERPPYAHRSEMSGDPRFREAEQQAMSEVHQLGLQRREPLMQALFDLQQCSIEQALASDDRAMRALALVDKRCGKRRLRAMTLKATTPLELLLFRVRCAAEEIVQTFA